MADYSSPLGTDLNKADINEALEDDLPVLLTHDSDGTDKSTTSTTYVDLHTRSVTTSTDEVLDVTATINASNATAGQTVSFRIEIDGSARDPEVSFTEHTASTSGNTHVISFTSTHSGLTGSVDVKIQWKVDGGTAHTESETLTIRQFKMRS